MYQTYLFHVFIYLAAASIIIPLTSRFKLGSVIGYLIIGILISSYGFKLIDKTEQIMHFAEFGIIMMLFLIGLELEPQKLWTLRKLIIGLGGLQVVLTTLVLFGIGLLIGYEWPISLAVSMALTLSSTALVLQMLQEKNLIKTAEGETAFSVLLFQDIAVIPILIIMPLLHPEHTQAIEVPATTLISHLSKISQALIISAAIGSIIFIGHYLSHHLFLMIAKTKVREVFTAFSLALVLGITLLMNCIGVSPALGAFIAGVVLANSQYKHTVEADIQPFKGLLLGLFFISVGMGMNFSFFAHHLTQVISIVIGLIVVKALILGVLGYRFGLSKIQTLGFALALSQGSEFAFVLFEYARSSKVLSADLKELYTLAVALSMLTTPILIMLYQRYVMPFFLSAIPKRAYDTITEKNDIILAGYGRFGQIIGRLLNGEKINITILEKNAEQIELLRKFGYHGYFGDASRLDLLKNAGAEHAKLLIVAVGDVDKNLQIIRLAKQHFPNLTLFARARNRRHAYELHQLGVTCLKRELFYSSLEMTKEILKFLGYTPRDIQRKTKAFERYDEMSLYKSFEFFNEERHLINFTRQAKGELERILSSSAATSVFWEDENEADEKEF